MNAEIVSVGTELLLGQITDTHAPTTARILAECGIGCTRRTTVGDNWDRLVGTLRESLSRADLVITIGGLGPTLDDLTRDAIAAALDDAMESIPEMEEKLRKFFELRKMRMTDSILRQAMKPNCATLIDNPNGTAPGLICQKAGKVVIAMPGPKGEFEPMAKGPVREFLSTLAGEGIIHSRVVRVVGLGESLVEDAIKDLMDAENPTVAPYAHTGEVHLRLTAKANDLLTADKLLDPVEAEIRSRLGSLVYGLDETTLEQAVIRSLVANGATVATAESMTGGQLAARLTSVPGSSAAFVGGFVTYSVEQKRKLLGVPGDTLAQFGPVSSEVASAMAEGTRDRLGVTYAVSITGNAGPTSDIDGKPVGLTYIACSGPEGTQVEEAKYRGLREDIQRRATQAALDLLRKQML